MTYDEAVTAFSDFTTRWSQFSANVYAINDPHLQRRLDRIRQCGDQSYELLWIPAPYNAGTLQASAERLEAACANIMDQLTIRSMVSLDARDQVRMMESSHRMYRGSQQLSKLTTSNASRQDMQERFAEIDKDWSFIHATCRRLPSINRAQLAAIEHQCEQLRNALGSGNVGESTIEHDQLEQAAAALEGSAEYFDADLKRYERYLRPAAFQKSIMEGSNEFYHHAKELHEALHQREKLSRLQVEAEHVVDGWQQLTKDLRDIEAHGLSAQRAANLRRAHENVAPVVAQVAAALLER